ncbi:unnamed protein product, partial [Ixodes hexagonus]
IHLQEKSHQANVCSAINTCHSVTYLVRRVVKKHAGLHEKQASQLVHALALSKILYFIPYIKLTQQQLNKLLSALNTLYKASLNLPISTSNQKLYDTGLFLPLTSLLHLHRDRQLGRLSGTPQGRWILEQAGLSPIDLPIYIPTPPLPLNLRFAPPIRRATLSSSSSSPVPRHMSPGLNDGRRRAQAIYHNPPFHTHTVAYADASVSNTGGHRSSGVCNLHTTIPNIHCSHLRSI